MQRREDIDGVAAGRAVKLAFLELEVDGAVKRDNGEGGAGVGLLEVVVWVWVLKESNDTAGLTSVPAPSLSSFGDPNATTLAVVTDATAGECHVGGRRRGRDDCCFGGSERTTDLKEPGDDPLPGGNV
jgi:hypothetical protein